MRKLVLIVIAACIVVAILLLVPSGRQLSFTSSPNNHYAVQIYQTRPAFVGLERYVYLKASREGTVFLSGKLLYTGDFLDNDFNDLYPSNSWLSDSILKIGQPDGELPDTLHISNGSLQVKYLLIETNVDKFVLFDVEPGRAIDLPFHYFGGLSCQGEFDGSGKRFGDAVELLNANPDAPHPPTTFSVTVTADGVTIGSQVPLKHDTCCAGDRPDINHE